MRGLTTFLFLLAAAAAHGEGASDETLPVWLIKVPESIPTVFVGETATARFHRFDQAGGTLRPAGSYYMSIGSNGAGKQRDGDRRTPIGAYFVTEQLDTSRMHEKYGITAFVLDYPNAWDRRLERDGDGIWVHGVDRRDNGRRPPLDTDGCIALPNEDLDALSGLFDNGTTPVLIAESIVRHDANARRALASELSAAVSAWASSVARGDWHRHLSSYHAEFRHWGLNVEQWAALRLSTLPARNISDVSVDDLLLLGYPGEDGLYLSRFRQSITEEGATRSTVKRLYWRRDDSGELRIVAEDNG